MSKVIAVDFDGALCVDAWPEIGRPRWFVLWRVKRRQRRGDKLILWTCREGPMLDAAVAWCAWRGLFFDAVNENLPEMIERFGNDCRKIGADLYLDDKARYV
jgi:hypothetical protein